MNTIRDSPLNKTTPNKRIGLSRNRRTCICSERRKARFSEENVSEEASKQGETSQGTNDVIKNGKIDEVAILLDIWKNGYKNVFLHIFKESERQEKGKVDIKSFLQDKGLYTFMLNHCKDDPDFDFIDWGDDDDQ